VIEGARHLSEMADAGQYYFRRLTQLRVRVDQPVFRADLIKRVLDRAEVACAVIEDADHKRPFVDGNWPLRRWSVEQAYRSARAKHLKIASILWWLDRPYNTLACKFAPA